MSNNKPIILYNGSKFTVEFAFRENGTSESKQFFESLSDSERAKILKIIKRYADFGVIHNKEQFKKVEGKLWEFKDFQRRILMYHCARKCIALTNGFIKKTKKIPPTEIKRANQILNEYDEIRKGYEQ